jgi:hypothetical protein
MRDGRDDRLLLNVVTCRRKAAPLVPLRNDLRNVSLSRVFQVQDQDARDRGVR